MKTIIITRKYTDVASEIGEKKSLNIGRIENCANSCFKKQTDN
jgi:hypothetical protein